MARLTPDMRSELRRLKAAFDLAFAGLSRDAPHDGPDYRAARAAYDVWRIAIDQYGVPLIDMLDAAEAEDLLATGARPRRSPIERLTAEQQADLRAAFRDMDQMGEMVRLIDDP